jgi:hypothetical protein
MLKANKLVSKLRLILKIKRLRLVDEIIMVFKVAPEWVGRNV